MISGALRQGSLNTKLVREAGRLWDGDTDLADLNMPLYNGDDEAADGVPEKAQMLASQITAAGAVVISTPEYNQSIPGGLKNALDWVSRVDGNPWADKPVAIMSSAAAEFDADGRLDNDQYRATLTALMTKLASTARA